MVVGLLAVSVISGLAVCDGVRSRWISHAEFGEAWPLTVESGVLRCVDPFSVVFVAYGRAYAVNGFAKNASTRDGERKYLDIRAILKDDPDPGIPKMSLGPLIEHGNCLCD